MLRRAEGKIAPGIQASAPVRAGWKARARALAAAWALAVSPAPAWAQEGPIDVSAVITVDVTAVSAGDRDARTRALTNIDLMAGLDLAELVGWQGATAFVYVLDNRGGRPNDVASTLQGVNNIEVPDPGLRLFEAWIEQDLGGGASLRAGMYDLNSEFYANEAAGLLLSPSFGIGSELAATGPNGPSIFPSSALAARLNVALGDEGGFARVAVVNARASTLGDRGGVDFNFNHGVLMIAEVGKSQGPLRGSVGIWHYSRNPEALFETGPDGEPARQPARGAYVVIEGDLLSGEDRTLTAFLRAGLASPHTTPFDGGFQTGLLLTPAFTARPNSQFSIGVQHAWTNDAFRDAFRAQGGIPTGGESGLEVTYADSLTDWLTIQPDLQWVHNPGSDAPAGDVVVATLRLTASF
jgi:porin